MAEWEDEQENQRRGVFGDRLVGLVLLLACLGLLWWQESRLPPEPEGARDALPVHEVAADTPVSLPARELVHMSGPLRTQALLTDSLTGASVCSPGIRREVEYFQWVEVKRAGSGDGEAAYAYHQRWVSRPVDSSAFHSEAARRRYANMVLADIPDESRYAGDVTLCGYRLPPALVATLPAEEPLAATVSDALRDRLNWQAAQAHRSASRGPLLVSNVVHAQGGIIYIGAGGTPRNGDVRIVLSRIAPEQVSLLAAVQGADVVPCRVADGREICRLVPGRHSASDMLASLSLPGGSRPSVWPLRLAAALGGVCGLYLLLRPARRDGA